MLAFPPPQIRRNAFMDAISGIILVDMTRVAEPFALLGDLSVGTFGVSFLGCSVVAGGLVSLGHSLLGRLADSNSLAVARSLLDVREGVGDGIFTAS
jgi:hypothetical protein